MPPAARLGDHHTCPKVEPGPVPHVGGPILPACATTVLVGDQPAARVGDKLQCNAPPDNISQGEGTVLIQDSPAARIGDPTVHGGVIVAGLGSVLIGSDNQVDVMRAAARSGAPFCEECARRAAAGDASLP